MLQVYHQTSRMDWKDHG